MRRRRIQARRHLQQGVAMLVLMALIALGGSWLVVSAMNAATSRTADNRARNGAVLSQAKQALVAWAAAKALEAGENNPGRLPCPEAAGYYGDPNQEGIAAPFCSLPAVGRLPWRTLGLDKLTDAAGEPLWYVVSPGWALPNSSATLTINSNTQGQLTVDGQANAAIALIIAPGAAMNVQAAAGCTARIQARNKLVAPGYLDYLECENAGAAVDAIFQTSGPAASFNDQVVRVTTADLLPALEAAISKRIERDIVPALRDVYSGSANWWTWWGYSPVYPFAAPFANPAASNFRGVASPATYQGLLPMASAASDPGFVAWNPASSWGWHSWGGVVVSYECGTVLFPFTATELRCQAEYSGQPVFGFWAQAFNVGNALRSFNPAAIPPAGGAGLGWYGAWFDDPSFPTFPGSAWVYAQVVLPMRATTGVHSFNLPITFLADHPLLDPNDPSTGWFLRNQWHHLAYYAVSPGFSPSVNITGCVAAPGAPSCIRVNNAATPDGKRVVLALAGRSLTGQARPNDQINDFLDTTENRNGDTTFEQKPVGSTFNDRFVVVDANP